jgi:hypothetical protein
VAVNILRSLLQPYLLYIALGSAILSVVCLIIALVAISSNRRLKRRLRYWNEVSSTADLEGVFQHTQEAVHSMQLQMDQVHEAVERIGTALKHKVSTPAIQRFNAFAEVGSDLSYSVALLDEEGDGVVLTSIYGRDDSVTYGKPVQHGESTYMLTSEEQAVIQSSMEAKRQVYAETAKMS